MNNKVKKLTATMVLSSMLLTACAKTTKEIETAYVSPVTYKNFDCEQISAEMVRVGDRANTLAYQVNEHAENDETAMAVGLILFWPALFLLEGDSPQAMEFANLKGEYDALENTAKEKECGLEGQENPFTKIEADLEKAKEEEKANQTVPAYPNSNR